MDEKRGVFLDLLRPALFAISWVAWLHFGDAPTVYIAKVVVAFIITFYFLYTFAYYERIYVRCNQPVMPTASRLRCLGRVDVRGFLGGLVAAILFAALVIERDVLYAVFLGIIFAIAVYLERKRDFAATRALLCFFGGSYVLVEPQETKTKC